eukprot:Gb_15460 [translate_table: standard]
MKGERHINLFPKVGGATATSVLNSKVVARMLNKNEGDKHRWVATSLIRVKFSFQQSIDRDREPSREAPFDIFFILLHVVARTLHKSLSNRHQPSEQILLAQSEVYAWEMPGVAGNSYNGLTPTVALQLAAVIYGENLFSEPLEDLNAAWLLECLRTLVEGLAFEEREALCQTLSMADLKVMNQRCFGSGWRMEVVGQRLRGNGG